MNIALVIGGGGGSRTKQDIPKQFLNVYDKPVIIYTLEAFQQHPNIDSIYVVCLEGWSEILTAYCKQFNITKLEKIVAGGAEGMDSIRNGIFSIKETYSENDIVLIHDGVRPLVSAEIISDNLRVCAKYGNAITAIPCQEAVLFTTNDSFSDSHIPRDSLKRTQTPHAFYLGDIISAHDEAKQHGITSSVASCTLFVDLGRKVHLSIGSEKNIKITTSEDLEIFKALLNSKKESWLK
jgi:2-C-methyl-D-erythritol 4-phosphate cytidylyltransferase